MRPKRRGGCRAGSKTMPLGGRVEEDYAFETRTSTGGDSTVRFSELFLPGKDTLLTRLATNSDEHSGLISRP